MTVLVKVIGETLRYDRRGGLDEHTGNSATPEGFTVNRDYVYSGGFAKYTRLTLVT